MSITFPPNLKKFIPFPLNGPFHTLLTRYECLTLAYTILTYFILNLLLNFIFNASSNALCSNHCIMANNISHLNIYLYITRNEYYKNSINRFSPCSYFYQFYFYFIFRLFFTFLLGFFTFF